MWQTLLTGLRNEDDRSLRKILASHEQVTTCDVDARRTTAPHRPQQYSSYPGTSVEPAVFANTP